MTTLEPLLTEQNMTAGVTQCENLYANRWGVV